VGLHRCSGELSDTGAPDSAALARAGRAALDGVTELGGATLGDKTLVDALVPFVTALEDAASAGSQEAWRQAAQAATTAADGTASLSPRLGRARPLAERSVGHPDPGAVSLALIARTVANFLASSGDRS